MNYYILLMLIFPILPALKIRFISEGIISIMVFTYFVNHKSEIWKFVDKMVGKNKKRCYAAKILTFSI